jgi:hypothetical protein
MPGRIRWVKHGLFEQERDMGSRRIWVRGMAVKTVRRERGAGARCDGQGERARCATHSLPPGGPPRWEGGASKEGCAGRHHQEGRMSCGHFRSLVPRTYGPRPRRRSTREHGQPGTQLTHVLIQVIVTSFLFPDAKFSEERLAAMSQLVGKDRLVVDIRWASASVRCAMLLV